MNIEKVAQEEGPFTDCFELLLELAAEVGFAPVDRDKAAGDTYRVIGQGMTFMARNADGLALGVLGLVECDFWYSDLTFLASKWFYVKPEHRFGKVGVRLLKAAKAEADERGAMVFVATDNPARGFRRRSSWATVTAQGAGYFPAGYVLRLGER